MMACSHGKKQQDDQGVPLEIYTHYQIESVGTDIIFYLSRP